MKKEMKIGGILCVLLIIISFMVLSKQEELKEEPKGLTIGVFSDSILDDAAIISEFSVLEAIDSIDNHIGVQHYDSLAKILSAYQAGDIQVMVTDQKVEGFNDGLMIHDETPLDIAIYARQGDYYNHEGQLNGARLGLVDQALYEAFKAHFSYVGADLVIFDNYEALINHDPAWAIDYIFVPNNGKFLYVDAQPTWHRRATFDLGDLSHYIYISNTVNAMNYSRFYVSKRNNILKEFDRIEKELLHLKHKEAFYQSLTSEELDYLNTLDQFTISLASDYAPMYYKDQGILVEVFDFIQTITDKPYKVVVDDAKVMDQAQDYLHLRSDQYDSHHHDHKMVPIINSSLLIVGPIGNNNVKYVSDLAFSSVGIVQSASLDLALRTLYPMIEVKTYSSASGLIEELNTGLIDFAIMDEYQFLFSQQMGSASNLNALANYNYDNDIQLFSHDNTLILSIIEKALNYMDEEAVLNRALLKSVAASQNHLESIITYFVIILLVIVLIGISYKFLKIRSEKSRLDYLSTHDPLTGAYNMKGLGHKLKGPRLESQFKLVIVDINRFKKVNDELSYKAGNMILVKFIKELINLVGDNGFVARNGGDEFIVLLDCISLDDHMMFIDKIYQDMTKYLCIIVDSNMSISVGVSDYVASEIGPSFTQAEKALHSQKALNKPGIMIYSEDLHQSLTREKQLSKEVYSALLNDEFVLYFQPQHCISSELITGYEALVRWQHPTEGLLSPYHFLHIIKKENLMKQFDYYIFETALKQMQIWQEAGFRHPVISVNMTTRSVSDPEFINVILEITKSYDVDLSRICFEITEDYEILEQGLFKDTLKALNALGISVAIDDFGAGYSSLSYIVKYPIKKIKIDRSLVGNITKKSEDLEFLMGIIDIMKNLGKTIIIEGVEEADQIMLLRQYEKLNIQGYFFSKPLPVDKITTYHASYIKEELYESAIN